MCGVAVENRLTEAKSQNRKAEVLSSNRSRPWIVLPGVTCRAESEAEEVVEIKRLQRRKSADRKQAEFSQFSDQEVIFGFSLQTDGNERKFLVPQNPTQWSPCFSRVLYVCAICGVPTTVYYCRRGCMCGCHQRLPEAVVHPAQCVFHFSHVERNQEKEASKKGSERIAVPVQK